MRMQIKLGAAILTAVLLGAGAMPAAAQKSADTLRIVMRDALPNIDPYYNNLRTGVVMHHQGWDALVYRNPDTFKLEPLLATEWKLPDATTIEFTLRPGVKFHDGSPFTADDVVYTINLDCRSGEPAVDALELQLARQGGEDRRSLGARQAEAAEPRGAGIFRARHPDLSQGLSREGRRGRLCQGAGRRGSVQDDQGRARRLHRLRAVRGLLGRQPQGEACDQEDERALRAGRRDRDDGIARRPRRLDLEPEPGPVRAREPDAAPAGGAQGIDADRLSLARCRRPHRRRQPHDQAQGASGDLVRDRPQGDRRQARHRRQPRSARAMCSVAIRL